MKDIREIQRQRLEYLIKIYELTEGFIGSPIPSNSAGKKLGLSHNESVTIEYHLQGEGFIKFYGRIGDEEAVWINHEGIVEAERYLNSLKEMEQPTKKVKKVFVSMSFEDSDFEINDYVTNILKSLQIAYETGERYSKDNIPKKVETRISNSDIFILILVRRDKIEGGGYTSPAWLLKELGIAQGDGKEIIAWVENDIKDIGGLDYEKELIYFTRNNLTEMKKATIKFLEALKEHGLI